MAFAETAKLAVELNLAGNFKSGIASAERSLAGLNRQSGQIGQGFKTMGAGIGVAFRNVALLAIPVVAGLTAGLIKSVKEGQDAAKVQTIYATAVANSGKVSAQYVAILNAQQKALENLGGVDDELIKTEQTRLIQMGLTGDQVAKLTPLILDMSKATGRDLLTTTLAVGKAVNGNVAGLQRYGVNIDKTAAKTDAFGAVQDALNKKFGGTTKALSGSLEARLGAFQAALQDIREEAGIKLLPALTRIVDIAGKDLVPAFGKFVDRIMPSLLDQVNKFADALENGGAERGIKGITDALGPMIDMLKIAAAPVKLIVDAFLKLPSQVQGLLIGAFAINKLSGGLIGQGAGQVVSGGIQALLPGLLGKLGLSRGASPANPMFVSDVTGGLGGAGAIGATGIWSKVGKVIGGAFAIVAVAELADVLHGAISPFGGLEGRTNAGANLPADQLAWPFGPKNTPRIDLGPFHNILGGDSAFSAPISALPVGVHAAQATTALPKSQPQLRDLPANQRLALAEMAILGRGTAAGFRPTQAAVTATYERDVARALARQATQAEKAAEAVRATTQAVKDGDSSIVAAIHGIPGSSTIVNVTASDIQKVQTQRRNAVKAHGSAHSMIGGPTV